MRSYLWMWGMILALSLCGCDRFGKHGALIDTEPAGASRRAGIVESTSDDVAACDFLGEFNSRADKIDNGQRNIRIMAADLGATHLVWTATERFDDAIPSQRAFVSAKAYRCK